MVKERVLNGAQSWVQHHPGEDHCGVFVVGPTLLAKGREHGPLSGIRFAVKDLFDVAGTRTGRGNPAWLTTDPIEPTHARAVQALIEGGADLLGKTVTDELAFSLAGTNVHYGTPLNSAAPARVPGGSSSGSVAAVAGGLVDFALGTDTGGSIRVPASYCGVFGIRPSHGRIDMGGVMTLAGSFCTAGLFARSGAMLERSWLALCDGASSPSWTGRAPRAIVQAVFVLFALADERAREALSESMRQFATRCGLLIREGSLGDAEEIARFMKAFRTIQMYEAWKMHGSWIASSRPNFGPGIGARFAMASRVDAASFYEAEQVRDVLKSRLAAFCGKEALLVQPATSGVAPLLTLETKEKDDLRTRTLFLTAIAGLAGAPVVVLPLASVDGLPVGRAAVGLPGDDDALLALSMP